jgi:hypothetical protein
LPDGTYEAQSLDELGVILQLAYGSQPQDVIERCHRGLRRTIACLEAGDFAKAGLEAVMIGLPGLTSEAVSKLGQAINLGKSGDAWRDEPRVPAGQPDGGQWTTGGVAADSVSEPKPRSGHRGRSDRSTQDGAPPADTAGRPSSPIDDAVYRPSRDRPALVHTGGGDLEPRAGTGAEPPPVEPMTLDQMFPALKNNPGLGVLNAVTNFLGIDAAADGANLDVALGQYRWLVNDIHSIDPNWRDSRLYPPGGIAALSWEERNNLIDDLRMKRAVLYYTIKHDAEPLQVETIRFLQREVDNAFSLGKTRYELGQLDVRLSRAEAIGNFVDRQVRDDLKYFFTRYGVPFGVGQEINVNNRNYVPPNGEFRIPDLRIVNLAIDWTLTPKSMATAQVRGFLRTDAQPTGVVIVRPSQLGHDSPYLIQRPYGPIKKVAVSSSEKIHIPETIGDVDDCLSGIFLHAPIFKGQSLHLPRRRYLPPVDSQTTFYRVNEGLKRIRPDLGDELYATLVRMSDEVKALYEADPVDKIGATRAGEQIVGQMQDLLKARAQEIGWTE